MTGRTIAIGDIHGCSKALAALIESITPTPDDTVIALGDYIDCGPDSRDVLDQLLELERHCRLVPVLGNHEEMLLAAYRSPSALKEWVYCGGKQTLASYGHAVAASHAANIRLDCIIPEKHRQFLLRCLPFFQTPSHIFTHACYLPHLPMDQQPAEALRWMFVNPEVVQPHFSGKVAVVGHSTQRGGDILDLGFLKCLDTGCEPGGWLTALDVDTNEIRQANKRGELRVERETARRTHESPRVVEK